MKDVWLSLPLIEVMKIVRHISPFSDIPRIAKAEAWQATCFSLSPKSLYSLLPSVAGSSSSLNFLNCSTPRQSASVFADYLSTHFSVSQPKALRSKARVYLSERHRARCSKDSHSSFCSPAKFLASATNLSSSTATGPDKTVYPMPKHLSPLACIFNFSRSLHSFPSIWKTFSIILIHKMGKLLDSPASFRPISLTCCVSKFLNALFYHVYSSFWSLIIFLLLARPASALDGLVLIKFFIFLSPFRTGLTNPVRDLGRSSLQLISRKL